MIGSRLVSAVLRRTPAAVGMIALLGGCELMLAEAPPDVGQTCAAWIGGCVPIIDYGGEETPGPVLLSERHIVRNVADADRLRVPECDTAPVVCQLEMAADILEDRYIQEIPAR